MATTNSDFFIDHQGTKGVMFMPLTVEAELFLERWNTEPSQWKGKTLCVDHMVARDLLQAITEKGFNLLNDVNQIT